MALIPLESPEDLVQFVLMFPTELRIPKNGERFFPLGIVKAIAVLIAFGLPVGAALAQESTPTPVVQVELDGAKMFNMYCAACHLLKEKQVGPSLIEIAMIHKANPQGIVDWAMNPGKKRPDTIQMPPMNYVGSDNLKSIADYILSATEGMGQSDIVVTQVEIPSLENPIRPKVQRIFMPDAGPAAVAVALPGSLSYCWDAGSCSLRYFWRGDFIDPMPVWRANGNALAKILGDISFVTAPDSPFEIDGKPVTQVQYLGYRLRKGAPEFHYTLNGVRFREWIQPLPDDEGIRLIFETDGDLNQLRWFPKGAKAQNLLAEFKVESNRGTQNSDGSWTLNKAESRFFHITLRSAKDVFSGSSFGE